MVRSRLFSICQVIWLSCSMVVVMPLMMIWEFAAALK